MKDEEEAETDFCRKLKSNGWIVDRQIECDQHRDWEYPHRIDVIASHPSLGILNPVVFELKYLRQRIPGNFTASAFKQLCGYTPNIEKIHKAVIEGKQKNVEMGPRFFPDGKHIRSLLDKEIERFLELKNR